MDIIGAIKKVVADYLENEKMSDVIYATYTGNSLKLDNKPVQIPLDMVDIPERLQEYNVKFSFELNQQQCDEQVFIYLKGGARLELESMKLEDIPCKIVYDKLKSGDRVAVVQKKEGQRFSIMDKVMK